MTAVSNTFYIVLPIVALAGMFGWLGVVFWAAAHPQWRSQRTAVKHAGAAAGQPGALTAVSGPEGTGQAPRPTPSRPRHAA